MNQNSGGLTCVAGCWLIAFLGGVLVAALLMLLVGSSFVLAAFLGLLVLLVGGLFLSWKYCEDSPATGGANTTMPEKTAEQSNADTTSTGIAAGAAAETVVAPAPLMDTPATQAVAAQPAAKKPDAKKATAAKKPVTKTAATKKTATKKAPAKKAAAATSDGPEVLGKPRAGGADDLKLISGVGPGLEKTLNDLGFWHFDQVASWKKKDIEWVDSRLKFKGRIERDDWVTQAKALAKGSK